MTPEKARELVAKELPGHTVKILKSGEAFAADSQGAGRKPHIEIVSPMLKSLKRRYFSDNASDSPQVVPDQEDSGVVMVEKEGSRPQAVVFKGGKMIGGQG